MVTYGQWSLMLLSQWFQGWGACHELCPGKTEKLVHKCCMCSDCSTNQLFSNLYPSPQASLFPKVQQYQNYQYWIINWYPTVTSKYSSERKCCISLTLKQRLEMIALSEGSMWKSWTFCAKHLAKLWMQRERRKLKVLLQWTHDAHFPFWKF